MWVFVVFFCVHIYKRQMLNIPSCSCPVNKVITQFVNLSFQTECDVGYYTIKAGKGKCEPCPPNKYGTKCAFNCKCKAKERYLILY